MRRPTAPVLVLALAVSACGGASSGRAASSATQTATGSPTPASGPADQKATTLCHQHFPTTVKGQASDVAFARSPHGPRPVNPSPSPVAFEGLDDASPVAVCLVRPAEGGVDTVYAISVVDDRVVVVFRQSGSNEIMTPI